MDEENLTGPQRRAYRWLANRGGDGIFDNNGILLAHGELAPFMRSTWNALRDNGYLEFYNPANKGHGRAKIIREMA